MEALTRRIEWSIFSGSPKLNYDSDHPYRIIDNIIIRLDAILTKADCPSLMEFHLNTNWSWAKRRLAKFNGIKKGHFQLYLLEWERRFNYREHLDSDLRKLLRKN